MAITQTGKVCISSSGGIFDYFKAGDPNQYPFTQILDNFTGTPGTPLTSHTPDSGGSWSLLAGTSSAIIAVNPPLAGASLQIGGAQGLGVVHSLILPQADVFVETKYIAYAPVCSLSARFQDENNYYTFITAGGGVFQIRRGTTVLSEVTTTPLAVNDILRLEIIGQTISGYRNNNLILTYTDSVLQTPSPPTNLTLACGI